MKKSDAFKASDLLKYLPETFNKLLEEAEKQKAKRAEDMPTEQDALKVMGEAYKRLKELGWNDACYAPKDRSMFLAIEAGVGEIHECFHDGQFYWVPYAGDLWPSKPILFKEKL